MLQIPDQAALRAKNFFFDWPLHNKRWVRTFAPHEQDHLSPLPSDVEAMPKEVDPNWRFNWKEVLLFKDGNMEPFRPIIRVGAKFYTTVFSVKTRLFAMRVGPNAVDVQLYAKSMRYSPVGFYDPNDMGRPLVLEQSEMTTFIEACGHKVTRV